jgi:ribonuclease HI
VVRELGGAALTPDGRVDRTTNNRMELQAAIGALEALGSLAPGSSAEVRADSSYLVLGATRWLTGWKRRGWTRPDGEEVANRDLWEALDRLLSSRPPGTLRWVRIPGHAGVPGNERADAIALSFAEGRPGPLYHGPVTGYDLDLTLGGAQPGEGASGRGGAGPGFPVYLSLVSGSLVRHATWKECEALVKGVSGARFKKVRSSAEERETLRGWGVQRA